MEEEDGLGNGDRGERMDERTELRNVEDREGGGRREEEKREKPKY